MYDIFYNSAGRLRSVWRLIIFGIALFITFETLFIGVELGSALVLPRATYRWLFVESNWGFVIQSVVFFIPAAIIGWGCGYAFEDLPWRALGWALHRGWLRDTLFGLLIGAVSVCVAALVGALAGGYHFTLPDHLDSVAVARTFASSAIIFLLGAAAEEMIFRGYPLQTMMRSWPLWAAIIPTCVPFALGHLENPKVVPGFTFANTALAGAWLAVAFRRTRSLWLPFGIHWGWNFVQGAVLGSPVSGIVKITPDPLLRFVDAGPFWIGGGSYGIEGGAACTLALVLSTIFIWRTRLLSATPELRRYTNGEISRLASTHSTAQP
ncbi:MAG: protease family protein [Acidobacteriota bacterium]|nr:protease family protein [Acidobacteriota bacterium]